MLNVQKTSRPSYTKMTLGSITLAAVTLVIVSACTSQAKEKANIVTKPAGKAGVLAKIGDEEINEDTLMGDSKMDFFDLKKREYELRMDSLNRLIVEKLVGAEAKKANLPLEDYINKNIVKGEIKISDKDYQKFVKEKKIPESQINPQIKERIMAYLQQQGRQDKINAYVAKLTKSKPVEVYFEKPKMSVPVEVGTSAAWGSDKAPVTIVEFSDFQCPFCSRGAEVVNEIKKKYGKNKVRIAFKHFPLPMHKDAGPASEASLCVHEQDADKFWKYHDLAFKNQEKLGTDDLTKYAKDVGADMKKFDECFKAGKYKKTVADDMAYGEKLGVRSTPTFFVNGQLVAGALPIEQFSEMIDEALADAKK